MGPPQAALADGNRAGTGDLVRARLNTDIEAGDAALLPTGEQVTVTAGCC